MTTTDPAILARRLVAAAHEVLATARELDIREGPKAPGGQFAPTPPQGDSRENPEWLAVARQAYRDRRRRDEIFDAGLFGEPAWDILLDLFIAARDGKRISITSACIGSAAPSTTALRWLNILERNGLIEREGDARDMRRSFVRLTADGHAKMIDYFGDADARVGSDDAAARLRDCTAPRAVPRAVGAQRD